MKACEQFIEDMNVALPLLCRTKDLVKIGIFLNRQEGDYTRRTGGGPPFFKLRKAVIYPKQGVLDWLKANTNDGFQKKDKVEEYKSGPSLCCMPRVGNYSKQADLL
jgi:hypothetical protein